jgi:hypothetical protein
MTAGRSRSASASGAASPTPNDGPRTIAGLALACSVVLVALGVVFCAVGVRGGVPVLTVGVVSIAILASLFTVRTRRKKT